MSEANVKARSAGRKHNFILVEVDDSPLKAHEVALEANVSEANVKARSAGRKHNFIPVEVDGPCVIGSRWPK